VARFISLFSGVGGFDLGMEKAGHECVAQVEWDKNAAGVLKHRWPNVPLFCDVSKVSADDLPDCEFICYGFPCQDLSVAGKRKGLEGERSGLFFEATRLIRELIARGSGLRFALAENVAGLFSADDGLALARCIRELLESGACETGWVLVDSQYFGVAQRRKRVFIVSDFGGESVDEILAITESLPGHPAPSREARKGTAGDATKGVGEGLQFSGQNLISDDLDTPSLTLDTGAKNYNRGIHVTQGADVYNGQLTGETSATVTSATGIANASGPKVIEQKETYCLQGGGTTSLDCNGVNKEICFTLNCLDEHGVVSWNGDITPKASEDVSVTLRSQQGGEGVGVAHAPLTVRRLTPIECERLQGFPDNWTSEKMELTLEGNEWKATGKVVKQADGPRYKQMGNAVTVNVAEWIGKQIAKVL
jgi:DNA (cytosine-5)-methyltransferase 1